MVTSDGLSVIKNRMVLYSMRDGAGLMSFCFIVTVTLSLTTLTITRPQPHFTRVASLTVRQSLTDKLSLYFHTTHGSFVTFV